MNALIFGGMSLRHQEWVRQVAEALEPQFEEVRWLDYKHWDDSDAEMDLEYEIAQAKQLASTLDSYVVVAKSIGTVVATLATARGLLAPEHCVFMGFPLSVVQKSTPEVGAALSALPPTVFLHNEDDPIGSAEAVEKYLEMHSLPQYILNTLPGDTHDYLDLDLIALIAKG